MEKKVLVEMAEELEWLGSGAQRGKMQPKVQAKALQMKEFHWSRTNCEKQLTHHLQTQGLETDHWWLSEPPVGLLGFSIFQSLVRLGEAWLEEGLRKPEGAADPRVGFGEVNPEGRNKMEVAEGPPSLDSSRQLSDF